MLLLTIVLLTLPTILYLIIQWNKSYWKRRGLDYIEPLVFYGNTKKVFKRQEPFAQAFANFYKYFKGRGQRHGGIFLGPKPTYVPVDVEIVKNILQKDFGHFVNRGIHVDEEIDPLSAHLFNLEGEKWKNLRTKLTPTFTSGKMKMMFSTMRACTTGLSGILDEHTKSHEPVNIKDVFARFTTDIIGSVAFGIDCNSLKDPDSDFRRFGKKMFLLPKKTPKDLLEIFLSRKLLSKLGVRNKRTPQDVEDFFMDIVRSTVNYRESGRVFRPDVLHLLLQLKNRGRVADDEKILPDAGEKPADSMTIEELAAQCFIFFAAGFETSSTTMTFAVLELSLNQDVQERLREEIVKVLKSHGDEITYEAIMEMDYLDKVIQETLRKYPPVAVIPRQCCKDYKIPDTNVTLEAGTFIIIPVKAIHHDPDYYPEPEKFDPERFDEENKAKRPPMTFLAFGDGPRICIGARFGLLQAKVGLVAILKNFKFTLNDEKTKMPFEFDAHATITSVKGDVWMDVTRLEEIN
ncbi:unnamed protein product [Phyllotreta striolata]|uniref:Cytochrome P450 monooxygenase n=1 Tax=Phyllotreta striolata TaxID=444603 RepID=A0A9N9XLY0_PHYSR|nr:unnamed protein product [Phyllotreta striolata]